MLHPESQKPRPREQHETPGQVLPINRRKPFFGILPYARAKIIAAIQILNIIVQVVENFVPALRHLQICGGNRIHHRIVHRKTMAEEIFGRSCRNQVHIIIKIDKLFAQPQYAVHIQFNGMAAESRTIFLRQIVLVPDDVQFGMVSI